MRRNIWSALRNPSPSRSASSATSSPAGGSNDESRVCSIFDLHSYEEVKAVYDNLASRPRDAALSRQIHLWAHSYKLSMNHLFGIPD